MVVLKHPRGVEGRWARMYIAQLRDSAGVGAPQRLERGMWIVVIGCGKQG